LKCFNKQQVNKIQALCIVHQSGLNKNNILGVELSLIGFFWCAPFGYLYFLFFYNEKELGVEIDPGMALTPLPSSIGRGSNLQPSDCEPSALPLDHSFHLIF